MLSLEGVSVDDGLVEGASASGRRMVIEPSGFLDGVLGIAEGVPLRIEGSAETGVLDLCGIVVPSLVGTGAVVGVVVLKAGCAGVVVPLTLGGVG